MKPLDISPLLTDLYELTMAASYFGHDMNGAATFSLFLRAQPQRGYYVAAGLEPALDFLERMKFSSDDLAYLKQTGLFDSSFIRYLESFRFRGEVHALPEGTLFFPDEPVLEVTAPLIEAQIVETVLINIIGLHSLIATKASRCVRAAAGRTLIDFGLRRAQGADAGMAAARSTYLAGFDATSNVLAGKHYGIQVAGTMAHSYVQAFESEQEAFTAYARTFPERAVLLIDTYDTIQGAYTAVEVARQMQASGHHLMGVRLDSGDMAGLSRRVRAILDHAGLSGVQIFASGGFDEFGIADAVARGAEIDAYGVGTKVDVSADAPYLDMVYKMVQNKDRPVRKLSSGKRTLAGEKQLFRRIDDRGCIAGDIIAARTEAVADAGPLLVPVMKGGRRIRPARALEDIRNAFKEEFARLPEKYKAYTDPGVYPVCVSKGLQAIQNRADGSAAFNQIPSSYRLP